MDQPRLDGSVNRRRFLKTAAATTALTAWSLKRPAPARAAVQGRPGSRRRAEPKRGACSSGRGPRRSRTSTCTRRRSASSWADVQQLVRFNPPTA